MRGRASRRARISLVARMTYRLGFAVVVLAATHMLSGCLVLGLGHFYEPSALVVDDRLVGRWEDPDDGVVVTIERSEWRSYRVTYAHPIEAGALTGYLFVERGVRLFDLSALHGQDPGSFVFAGHALVRLDISDAELKVSPLAYDTLSKAAEQQGLPASLAAFLTERHQLVFAGSAGALHEWAASHARDASTFTPEYVFERRN
jgi:hypothetical protein